MVQSFPLLPATSGAVPTSNREALLLVANKGDRSLGIIDPDSGHELGVVAVEGITGHEVVASPDGKCAFVPIYGNSGVGGAGTDGSIIRMIDLDRRKIISTIDYTKGVRPHCAVFGPRDGLLYVTAELEDAVSVIDPHTLRIEASIPTGQPESHMLAITSDGRTGYTANVGPGTVSVLDLQARKLVSVISVARRVQRVSISTDDKWVFTADQERPRLAVIKAADNSVSDWVELPGRGYGTAHTSDGRSLLVALPSLNRVAVVDLSAMKVVRSIEVPKAPQFVLAPPDRTVAYVSCDVSAQIAVIDLQAWKVDRLIQAGHGADGLAWAQARSR